MIGSQPPLGAPPQSGLLCMVGYLWRAVERWGRAENGLQLEDRSRPRKRSNNKSQPRSIGEELFIGDEEWQLAAYYRSGNGSRWGRRESNVGEHSTRGTVTRRITIYDILCCWQRALQGYNEWMMQWADTGIERQQEKTVIIRWRGKRWSYQRRWRW